MKACVRCLIGPCCKPRIDNYAQSSYHVTLPFNCLTCISSFCSHPRQAYNSGRTLPIKANYLQSFTLGKSPLLILI